MSPPTDFPLPDPFGPAPTDAEVKWQRKSNSFKSNVHQSYCSSCETSMPTALIISQATEIVLNASSREKAPALLFRPLVLTDCCSLYSAILRIQPRSQDKCAKLILNQLRDLQTVLDISFVDNSCNLGDVETKHAVSLGILTLFMTDGHFQISFLGRNARKEAQKWTSSPSV